MARVTEESANAHPKTHQSIWAMRSAKQQKYTTIYLGNALGTKMQLLTLCTPHVHLCYNLIGYCAGELWGQPWMYARGFLTCEPRG